MIQKEFVPYEEALALKELGFDEPCFAVYFNPTQQLYFDKYINEFNKDVRTLAPTFSQAFRWFRENYGLNYEISYAGKVGEYHAFVKDYTYGNNGNSPSVFTYEEAELVCLKRLIELVKNKQ